jgi:hypothetical protein
MISDFFMDLFMPVKITAVSGGGQATVALVLHQEAESHKGARVRFTIRWPLIPPLLVQAEARR